MTYSSNIYIPARLRVYMREGANRKGETRKNKKPPFGG